MQMKFTLHKENLSEQVADMLEQRILQDGLQGEKLPSEQSLSEQLHVSRTIVREAMKLLSARGLIDSRTGSGAFVTKPEAQHLSDVMYRIIKINSFSVRDIYGVRETLEVASVRKAAELATEQQLEAMQHTLEQLKNRDLTVLERRDFDYRFHYLIAEATNNPMMALLVETLSFVLKDMIKSGIMIQGGIDDAIIRHERIMSALLSRDPELAERRMREHLRQSECNNEVYFAGKSESPGLEH